MRTILNWCVTLAAPLAALTGMMPAAHAQSSNYPDRAITLVIPFAPGASTDVIGRLIAAKLADGFKVPVTSDNRVGAGGAIGTRYVAQSAPDGHTLLLVVSSFTTTAAALPDAGYDPITQFAPVSMIATSPLLWTVTANVPVKNMGELIDYARANPGKINYGSAGMGSITHLVLELFLSRTGVKITHVPYKGVALAVNDMVGGQIQLTTASIPAVLPFIKDGKFRPLAVTSAQRTNMLPQVPSMSEAGLKGFDVLNYYGIVAPAHTPVAVVTKLNGAINRAIALPDVADRFKSDAVEAAPGAPEQLGKFLAADYEAWRAMVKATNLKIE